MSGAMGLWVAVEALAVRVMGTHSAYQLVWTRYAVHLCLMLLLVGPRRARRLVETRRPGLQLLRSLSMLGMPTSFVTALRFGSAQDLWMVFWASPLIGVALAATVLREAVPAYRWAAAACGFVGAFLILGPPGSLSPIGALLSLTASACFALYLVMTRALRHESTESKLFFTAFGVLACLSPVVPFLWKPVPAEALLAMMGVGALGLVSLWLLDKSLEWSSASLVVPVAYTQLLWLVVVEHVGLARRPHLSAVLGAVLVAGAALVVAGRAAGRPTDPG